MLVSTVASVTIIAPLSVITTRVTYKTERVFRVNQGGVEYIAIKVRSHILHRHCHIVSKFCFFVILNMFNYILKNSICLTKYLRFYLT